jgi:hypothetical protein|tara:strand:+ start:461 stop:673 length:213 start_codon:yes stop_codon:yes gene_type:complete
MTKKKSHVVFFLSNNQYYIAKSNVLGTWSESDQNWEAFFKRTYPEINLEKGEIFHFSPNELLDFINTNKS